ncbi:hypothetical protein [Erwinia pyrifoliae]|uniref:hypothetical protein n=1 Tax=Erwinia pyrifoliae TaxID=79967 RepID=UPI002202543E|nr:hypothetical protein [Erwinia pyrifoliae]UWS30859.1 hypothetical protein NYP81_05215 [Erwinia pyrifoliae]
MYQRREEKSSDKMLGEALMARLKQDAAINNSALMMMLHSTFAVEIDLLRQVALKRAMVEVSY